MAPPLFLLAPPRSYTSVICAMLGQHPQMFGLPELNLFNVKTLKELWREVSEEIAPDITRRQGLLRAIAEIYGGEQTQATIVMAIHWVAARQDMDTGEVYKELVERMDPLILVEKSPAYTIHQERMERIFQTFPEARFIHLTRHPITQGRSVMNLNEGIFAFFVESFDLEGECAILDPQYAWYQIHMNILNFLEKVPKEQYIRMKGEDIMENPEERLREICEWLGVRTDDEAISRMMRPQESPFACFGPLTAMFGNDPNFLRRPTFRRHKPKLPPLDSPLPWRNDGARLKKEIIELAREFGYK